MTDQNILESIEGDADGLEFFIRPKNFFYVPRWQLKIDAYRTFFHHFDNYLENLGYKSIKSRDGAEDNRIVEEVLKEESEFVHWYTFDGAETTRYERGNEVIVLETDVHESRSEEKGGYCSDCVNIKSVKMTRGAARDALSAILSHVYRTGEIREKEIEGTMEELQTINSLKSKLENASYRLK